MKRLALALTALLAASSANAAFESVDIQVLGDGHITRDTSTGLDWLDLTQTAGLTYDYVHGEIGGSGFLSNWRYATADETETLFANLGFTNTVTGGLVGDPHPAGFDTALTTYLDLFGDLYGTCCAHFLGSYGSFGVYDEPGEPGSHLTGGAGILFDGGLWELRTSRTGAVSQLDDVGQVSVGHFLVRASPVPLPAAAWLLLSGLGGLATITRRRRAAIPA